MRVNPEASQGALDIEDLARLGRGSGPCPYYTARALADGADLVFMPYNYLARAPPPVPPGPAQAALRP